MFLFDLYGVVGLQNFLIEHDKKAIDKILFGFEKMKLADNKLTLVRTKFLTAGCKNLTDKEVSRLIPAAKDFFHFIDEFAKLHNIKSKVVIHMLEDQIQKTKTDACGVFQLYFYKKLFGPQDDSAIISHKKLTKNTIQMLLNEIF